MRNCFPCSHVGIRPVRSLDCSIHMSNSWSLAADASTSLAFSLVAAPSKYSRLNSVSSFQSGARHVRALNCVFHLKYSRSLAADSIALFAASLAASKRRLEPELINPHPPNSTRKAPKNINMAPPSLVKKAGPLGTIASTISASMIMPARIAERDNGRMSH